MKRITRTIGIFLSLCLIMGLLPTPVRAAEPQASNPYVIHVQQDTLEIRLNGKIVYSAASADRKIRLLTQKSGNNVMVFTDADNKTRRVNMGQTRELMFSGDIDMLTMEASLSKNAVVRTSDTSTVRTLRAYGGGRLYTGGKVTALTVNADLTAVAEKGARISTADLVSGKSRLEVQSGAHITLANELSGNIGGDAGPDSVFLSGHAGMDALYGDGWDDVTVSREQDGRFLSFDATTTDIPVGASEMVHFSAKIEAGYEPRNGRIPVYDETGALICYLYDDAGMSGGSQAGGNVYSGQAELSGSEKRTATLTAISDGVRSAGLAINFYEAIDTSSPEYLAMLDIESRLNAIGNYSSTDVEPAGSRMSNMSDNFEAEIEQILEILNEGLENGTVLNVERVRESDTIFVDFASGVMYMWYPIIGGMSGGGAVPLSSREPCIAETTADRPVLKARNNLAARAAFAEAGLSGLPDLTDLASASTEGALYSPISSSSDTGSDAESDSDESRRVVVTIAASAEDFVTEQLESVVTPLLNADLNFTRENITFSETTIKKLKTVFKDKDVIFWVGHGDIKDNLGSILITGEPVTADGDERYSADLAAKRLLRGKNKETGAYTTYAVSPRFFNHYYKKGDMDGCIIYFGVCHSGANSTLAKSLIKKGASAVMGYSDEVGAYYSGKIMNTISKEIAQMHSSGERTKTISEAVSRAKKTHGSKCPYGSVLNLYGDGDAALYRIPDKDNDLQEPGDDFSKIDGVTLTNDTRGSLNIHIRDIRVKLLPLGTGYVVWHNRFFLCSNKPESRSLPPGAIRNGPDQNRAD